MNRSSRRPRAVAQLKTITVVSVQIGLFCLIHAAWHKLAAVQDESRSCGRRPVTLSWLLAAVSAGPYEDPQRILRNLPDREHANFLAAYALDGARDPAGWTHLRRVLRLWSGMVIATNRPGFYEAQEAAFAGTGGGMLLEDYIRLRRTRE